MNTVASCELVMNKTYDSAPYTASHVTKNNVHGVSKMRWTNLQPSGVTFPEDSIYQKLLKSVSVCQSYSKKAGSFF